MRLRLAGVALPALLLAAPLSADAAEPFRMGIGGSIDLGGFALAGDDQLAFVPSGFANLQVPMWIGDLRIEPEIGYVNFDSEETVSFDGESESLSFSSSAFRIGTGIAYGWEVAQRTRMYVGPRIGLIFRSTEFVEPGFVDGEERDVTTTVSATDFWIGAALGGEAFLTPGFSLGVEGQLNYVDFGEPDVDEDPSPEPTPGPDVERSLDESLLSTQVLVSARIYFL